MHPHHSRLEDLGINLAALVETGAEAALTLGARGLAISRGLLGGRFHGVNSKGCGCVRHHYHHCHVPPRYGCGGY